MYLCPLLHWFPTVPIISVSVFFSAHLYLCLVADSFLHVSSSTDEPLLPPVRVPSLTIPLPASKPPPHFRWQIPFFFHCSLLDHYDSFWSCSSNCPWVDLMCIWRGKHPMANQQPYTHKHSRPTVSIPPSKVPHLVLAILFKLLYTHIHIYMDVYLLSVYIYLYMLSTPTYNRTDMLPLTYIHTHTHTHTHIHICYAYTNIYSDRLVRT